MIVADILDFGLCMGTGAGVAGKTRKEGQMSATSVNAPAVRQQLDERFPRAEEAASDISQPPLAVGVIMVGDTGFEPVTSCM